MDQLSSRGIMAIVGSIVFLAAAPGMFGVFIPWYTTGWHMYGPLLGLRGRAGWAAASNGLHRRPSRISVWRDR